MPKRGPFTMPYSTVGFENMRRALKRSSKRPRIGVTQGGSSRRHSGAKVAAKDATIRRSEEIK